MFRGRIIYEPNKGSNVYNGAMEAVAIAVWNPQASMMFRFNRIEVFVYRPDITLSFEQAVNKLVDSYEELSKAKGSQNAV